MKELARENETFGGLMLTLCGNKEVVLKMVDVVEESKGHYSKRFFINDNYEILNLTGRFSENVPEKDANVFYVHERGYHIGYAVS